MVKLEMIVLVVLLVVYAMFKGIIIFNFKELEAIFTYASPLIYGYWLTTRRKTSGDNRGRGT